MTDRDDHRILQDIRVLDLTQYFSGPLATLYLSGLGAEVIRVDPPTGDLSSDTPLYAGPEGVSVERKTEDDMGAVFLKRCRAKKAITLNLKSEEGKLLFYRLVEKSDVVGDNFSVGVTKRLGGSYETLREINSQIVQCAITGFGLTGPDAAKRSYDVIAQAMSGLMSITGEPGGKAMKAGSPLADSISASFALSGILAALFHRIRTGHGQLVDISMVDCLFSLIYDDPLEAYDQLGMTMRQGNRIPRFSPFNVYETQDGEIVIGTSNNEMWRKLTEVMGCQVLATDNDFGRTAWRLENNDIVDGVVEAWSKTCSTHEALAKLETAGIPSSAIPDIHAIKGSRQMQARGMVTPLLHPTIGPLPGLAAAGFPIKFSDSETGYDGPAVRAGQHNNEIFGKLLGVIDEDINRLKDAGTI